jgi:hypothetical protein
MKRAGAVLSIWRFSAGDQWRKRETVSNKLCTVNGLGRNSSKPAPRIISSTSDRAMADTAITGMSLRSPSLLNCLTTSKPESLGSWMSMTIKSGNSVRTIITASWPFSA